MKYIRILRHYAASGFEYEALSESEKACWRTTSTVVFIALYGLALWAFWEAAK